MKLTTNTPVTYNVPNTPNSQATDIVEGQILNIAFTPSDNGLCNFDKLAANVVYNLTDGTIITQTTLFFEGAQVENTYNSIKDEITGTTHQEITQSKFYLMFRKKMANDFGINVSDINIA